MDIATIAGLVVGAFIVLAAILVGGDLLAFVDVPSTLIVLGGTLATTVIRFPLSGVLSALVLGGKVAFTHKKVEARTMIEEIAKLADIMRRNGPLGLENIEISDPLLAKGIQFISDGYEAPFIQETLERERDLELERLEEGKSIFKAMNDSAPAFGMIGTLVGLVQMLQTMDDPSTIGPSMAIALLTTLYGALIANLICTPVCDKLARKIKVEEVNSSLAIDGIMQIRENKSPNLIRELLFAYLPAKQRGEIAAEAEAQAQPA
ncbi:MAG: MotA/TolQ/ExbB proton channel family protein [Rhodobiaceae bacterium]|nr:MotA/TolQ/ExbB proton channel family protein [Rhodobiaceae bacterium]